MIETGIIGVIVETIVVAVVLVVEVVFVAGEMIAVVEVASVVSARCIRQCVNNVVTLAKCHSAQVVRSQCIVMLVSVVAVTKVLVVKALNILINSLL